MTIASRLTWQSFVTMLLLGALAATTDPPRNQVVLMVGLSYAIGLGVGVSQREDGP